MKIFLIVCVALWVLFAVMYNAALHGSRDDMGAAAWVGIAGLIALICTIVLSGWWIWEMFQ